MASSCFSVTVSVQPRAGRILAAPTGLSTPHALCSGCEVTGATPRQVVEATTGQPLLVLADVSGEVTFRYSYSAGSSFYPEAMFTPRLNRFTRAADALIAEAQAIAPEAAPKERARAVACAVAEKFTYGHTDEKFYDGLDEIPMLGCGLTKGSCVDINTYLVASFRAAGIEAGYVTGYFFPAEKGDHTSDMHCWVVTRIGGETQEWDIAHYLKMGTREIAPALNPKPGFRAAIAHSMGLDFLELGVKEAKLMGEPVWVEADGTVSGAELDIRLQHPELAEAVT